MFAITRVDELFAKSFNSETFLIKTIIKISAVGTHRSNIVKLRQIIKKGFERIDARILQVLPKLREDHSLKQLSSFLLRIIAEKLQSCVGSDLFNFSSELGAMGVKEFLPQKELEDYDFSLRKTNLLFRIQFSE